MDLVENDLKKLINGQAINDIIHGCDYSLGEQYKVLNENDSKNNVEFIPICKQSVFYIVCAVVINENNEILMMQEAKRECAGTWYLPAGKLEAGEHLIDGVKREVLEETGLHFKPTTLIMIENAKGNWYRFTFTGIITGGTLKTVSKADSQSLQASWIADIDQLSLRSTDMLSLIDQTRQYYKDKSSWHSPILPVIHPVNRLLLRVLFLIKKKANNRLHLLVSEQDTPHLPICEINPILSIHATLKKFVQKIFITVPTHKPQGILQVEHSGLPLREKDGACFTLVCSSNVPLEDTSLNKGYIWLELCRELELSFQSHLGKNRNIMLKIF